MQPAEAGVPLHPTVQQALAFCKGKATRQRPGAVESLPSWQLGRYHLACKQLSEPSWQLNIRKLTCGMIAMADRRRCKCSLEMSTPSITIFPESKSVSRKIVPMREVLPAPDHQSSRRGSEPSAEDPDRGVARLLSNGPSLATFDAIVTQAA